MQNGVISKYAIGLMASVLGQPIDAMNDPWFWGADYNDNHDNPAAAAATAVAHHYFVSTSVGGHAGSSSHGSTRGKGHRQAEATDKGLGSNLRYRDSKE